jgi:hypothetical protein
MGRTGPGPGRVPDLAPQHPPISQTHEEPLSRVSLLGLPGLYGLTRVQLFTFGLLLYYIY